MTKRKSVDLLPVIFRTDANARFLAGTVDQLIQPASLKKIEGYVGDRTVPNYSPAIDPYINDQNGALRNYYELEPGIVKRNKVNGKVEFSKTYEDILNSLKYFGSDISNQDKLFKQQSYSWNPHIDFDKFINYRNYVWLPAGPPTIRVNGTQKKVISNIKVKIVDGNWNFSNNTVAVNPTITLYRGLTYIFEVDSLDQPFYIKTKRSSGDVDTVENVINNGATSGNVIFEVGDTVPGTLFYVSGADNSVFGKILVRNQKDNYELNVETEILGKTKYVIDGNFNLSNGMKVVFGDEVAPESYRNKTYIVEGVGKSITLVDYNELVTIESYSTKVETAFDQTGFDELPFDEVSDYPVNPDYIVINRASKDKNPWSRYNRWFHIDIVTACAEYNGVESSFNETDRAKRPIIEFAPNIQLYNFATKTKTYVNYFDTKTKDAFGKIEGSLGYYIDGNKIEHGNRVVFTYESDLTVKNRIYEVQYIDIEGTKKVHLELTSDGIPEVGQGLLVLSGDENGRTSWVFDGTGWVKTQQKTSLNQAPLFDLFDENGNSFSSSTYKETNFPGTKIFGYQIGTGTNDPILGFPIKYGNVSNVGGYLFYNFLATDTWQYFTLDGDPAIINAKDGFLRINEDTVRYENIWVKSDKQSVQEIFEQQVAVGGETYLQFYSLDVRTPPSLIRVFKNGKQLSGSDYEISVDVTFDALYLNFTVALAKDDVILIKAAPVFDKKEAGYYETPINLINNPLNDYPTSISYAEINDHLNSILLNASKDLTISVNASNLRDLSDLQKYGRRFVQHEGLVAMAGAMLVDKEVNVISSIRWAALEYQRYKTLILQKFIELESYASASDALDKILIDISKDKSLASVFYYGDMVPYGLNKRTFEYTIKDTNVNTFTYGSNIYTPKVLGNNAVIVYLDNEQLVYGRDYDFDTVNPLVVIKRSTSIGQTVKVIYYNNVYGSCMPYSPTKLGLYPSYIPEIFLDDTFQEPTNVIQGHDGSITVCYGDDRDALLLELEKRIYNNLSFKYNPQIFDINEVVPGLFRTNQFDIERVNSSIEEEFLRWTGLYNVDYTTNENGIYENNFSYNFIDASSPINANLVLSGSWRKIYKYFYDTDRPNTHPWEMLGFYSKPEWWENEYGPAPYTSGNNVLWEDLEKGYIRQGDRQGYDVKYRRPGLNQIIPVDTYGNLKDPIEVNVVKSFDFSQRYQHWKFGDMGPAEAAWRRSSFYPFALQIAMALNLPAKYLTLGFDTNRNSFNSAGQLVYSETNQRLSLKDLMIFTDRTSSGMVMAAGYSPLIVEHLRLRYSNPADIFKSYINNIESNLVYKVGGFTSKDKFRISLETVTSYKTVDKTFIPEENYQLHLEVGSPVKTLSMSGIIVERTDTGFAVKGYDSVNPYFKTNSAIESPSDPSISVGGISESFVYWAAGTTIPSGLIVANGQKYYRAITTHVTKDSFDTTLYYPLPYLPTVGGIEATIPQSFSEQVTIVPYGTKFNSSQELFNFILGYGHWLETEGFVFDELVSELEVIANWELAGREFLFWSLQNWQTSSVISLAPFSPKIIFQSNDAVVDDVYDSFYDFTLLKSDGSAIDRNRINIVREEGLFKLDTSNIADDGVYFIKINLVQKEHVIVFDNFTIFNDLIYEPVSGYRQRRFKVNGFVTDGWQGDFYVPGFIYDSAKIEDWQPYVDYDLGDVVRYQSKYYQAIYKLLPRESFQYDEWSLLGKQPVAQLLPNFDYKISQFEDFYNLDGVNFDSSQQKFAQKLIGYVPRKYLNSLIVDETSQYMFYQGYIREKGTTLPLEKFSVAHNNSLGSHISIQEEWAIRLGTFGGENAYKEVEFTLDQNKFNQDPQVFEFEYGDYKSKSQKNFIVTPSSVLIKPEDYDGNPWPILDINKNHGNSYKQYQKLPTAGFVRIDDVTYTALYENNVLTISSNSTLEEGDTVWIAMNNKGDWTVKRYTLSPAIIVTYVPDNANNLIEFETTVEHNLKLRDFVSISRISDALNGIYEVIGIPTPYKFVVTTTQTGIPNPSTILAGSLYYFTDSRFATPGDMSTISGLARWRNCEYVWIDDDGNGNLVVYERENSTTPIPLRPYYNQAEENFGYRTLIAPVSKNIIVSAISIDKGRVYIYERNLLGSDLVVLTQSYILEENISDVLTIQNQKNGLPVAEMPRHHGFSVASWESDDLKTRYILSGAPNSSNAKWKVSGVTVPPLRKPLAYNFTSSGLFEEGVIKIVKYDNTELLYATDVVLASPNAQESAHFGHCLTFAGLTKPFILVSSPGQDNGQGSVFVYYLDGSNSWQVYKNGDNPYDIRSNLLTINNNSNFGWDIVTSKDGTTLAISAPGYLKDNVQAHTGAVFVFTKDSVNYNYKLTQKIYADDYLQSKDLLLKGVVQTYSGTVSLRFDSGISSLTRNTGSFIQDGFRIGQTVNIVGSSLNDGQYVLTDVSVLSIALQGSQTIVDENVISILTITGLGTSRKDRFGEKLAMDETGNTLLISSDHASQDRLDAGLVYTLKKDVNGQFVLDQTIQSPTINAGELFGNNLSLSPSGELLLITAAGGEQTTPMSFDSYTERYTDSLSRFGSEYALNPKSSVRPVRTTFDNGSTRFINRAASSGAVYMYQKLGDKFVYGESLVSGDSANADGYGTGIDTDGNFSVVGAPFYDVKVVGEVATTGVTVNASYDEFVDADWSTASFAGKLIRINVPSTALKEFLYAVPSGTKFKSDVEISTTTTTSTIRTVPVTNTDLSGSHSGWTLGNGNLRLITNGIPYHSYGNPSAVNVPAELEIDVSFPLRAGTNIPAQQHQTLEYSVVGYWLNGVAIYGPSLNIVPTGYQFITGFHYNAVFVPPEGVTYTFNEDAAGGAAYSDNVYHYTAFKFANAWTTGVGSTLGTPSSSEINSIPYLNGGLTHPNGHSKILGFALDGYPIYGPFGYSVPTDSNSPVRRMTSGYSLKNPTYRTGTVSNLAKYPMGIFIEDYEYLGNTDLDIFNGRYCKTPDYPNGTYAYFVTVNSSNVPVFPYVIGIQYYGEVSQAVPGTGVAPVKSETVVNAVTTLTTIEQDFVTTGPGYSESGSLLTLPVTLTNNNPTPWNIRTLKFPTAASLATTALTTFTNAGTAIIFDFKTSTGNTRPWTVARSLGQGLVDTDKIKKVISYNSETQNILDYYEIFDPVKGKLPTKVMQEIKYITPFDPAVYNVAVQPNSKVRVDNKTTWADEHVGELWLDTSTLRFVWYEQGSEEFRSNNWGKLFPGATVDVYEWVKSDFRPSDWNDLADKPEGLVQGISGQPRNPDNTVVSINQYYDPLINDFVNVYYFWVRNKITIPDLSFRSISSFECARIIEDPKSQGIKYASFLSPRSVSLTNAKKDLNSDKINIDIYYQNSEKEINRHSHWQLINENMKYLNIDPLITTKLFDSLVGQDASGNLVPDPNLSPKLKYGTLFRPRQSWFKNRDQALKTMLNYVNGILANYDVVGKVNLDNINTYDPVPLESYGYYDAVVETSEDIAGIGTNGKVQAELKAVITEGKITNVIITNPGAGYKIAPNVNIYGSTGSGAKIQTAIDLSGKVVAVKIINQGIGYQEAPTLVVRTYSVLVTLDLEINKWAIYHVDNEGVFQRRISQTYDTRKYWNYVDWVDTSYSTDLPPMFIVNFLSDLETQTFDIGDTIEIKNTGDGRKIILRKTAPGAGNYINDYDLIYRENGTIQFSSKLYDKSMSGIGYDNIIRFDQNSYDETLSVELRTILEAIKNDIFVGELAGYWNKFFFVAVRYVLSEQLFVDWIYKTSFITPVIDAGTLDQRDVYRFNDYSYVEKFIEEIKPYKSKFRDITVNHNAIETANVGVTDFDLPAYVDSNGVIRVPEGDIISNTYPFKHWFLNTGFSIQSIIIGSTGANYRVPPVVTIVPAPGDSGSGAVAEALISDNKLSYIRLINGGSGYLKTPSVIISGGGNYTSDFVPGTAHAVLTNEKVRTNTVTMKFDRISDKGLFTGEYYNRVFTTDGITLNYVLAYPVNDLDDNYPALQDNETIKLFLNDAAISSDNFRITFRSDLSTVITFNVPLPARQTLRIQYIKNILYTRDIFTQTAEDFKDLFQLTYPPVLDSQKIIVKLVNNNTKTGSEVIASDYQIIIKQVNVGFNKYVGYIRFKNTPTAGNSITIQYAKNINIQNAVDRIVTSYEPGPNMPGKDITQLLKGVEFGGVEVQGLNFTVSSGWDGLPWFTQGWDTFVNDYKDLLVISNGVKNTYDLGYVPTLGTQINVYYDGVRVDDENFNTPTQVNTNALFKTIIAGGSSSNITLPVVPANGTKIEVRQSISDGVNLPTDDFVLDTNITGGDFSTYNDTGETLFKTANGLKADDIVTDGGQFLAVEHSPATEELVKGEIFDTVAISVFNSPSTGSNLIKTYQFQYDGSTDQFIIDTIPDSSEEITVYVGNFAVDATTDYTVSYDTVSKTTITLTTSGYGLPDASSTNTIVITIQINSIGGDKILNKQLYIVTASDATASTIEIQTPVNIDDIGSFYTSTSKTSTLTKMSGRNKRAKLVIDNSSPKLPAGTLISLVLFSSEIKTYSEVYNQEITIGSATTYTLSRPPGNIEPLHVMAAVTRLTPTTINWKGQWADNLQYNIDDTVVYGNRSYTAKKQHFSLSSLNTVEFPDWSSGTVTTNHISILATGGVTDIGADFVLAKGSLPYQFDVTVNNGENWTVSFGNAVYNVVGVSSYQDSNWEITLDRPYNGEAGHPLFEGDIFVSDITYQVNDIVATPTGLYICIEEHISNLTTRPDLAAYYWQPHVANSPLDDTSGIYWTVLPTQRLLPPETEYYEVTQNAQTFSIGENVPYLPRYLSISDIETYKNGKMMVYGQDYTFDGINNSVTISSGVTQIGDVIAISVLRAADYYIRNGAITFTDLAAVQSGQKIVVTTYTNHDENLMRREVFKGFRYKNEYRVSRPIYNINNAWVDLNGKPLIPNFDYQIVDNNYIQLSERFSIVESDRIVVTSISDLNSKESIAYRQFKDMTNRTQFKRLSRQHSTTLTKELKATDATIEVADASIFGKVDVKNSRPSVIFIAGERIEFRSVKGNVLGNIIRGTSGTGVADSYPAGTKVFDTSQSETIPYREGAIIKTYKTPENYRYNSSTATYQHLVNGAWTNVSELPSYTLTGFNFTSAAALEDQVMIYMGGKLMQKPLKSDNKIYKHDFAITLYSDETNSQGVSGDIEVAPDFTIIKVGSEYKLVINSETFMRDVDNLIIPNVEIRVVQRLGKIWYTLNGSKTLQLDDTVQAKFLQEFPAELPDRYYYGKL